MNQEISIYQVIREVKDINFIYILAVFVIAWVLIRLTEVVFPWLAERFPGKMRLFVLPSVPVIRLVIVVVSALLIIRSVVEPTFQNFLAIVIALAVAIGYAFKDYINSLSAGIIAVYEHPYRPGDWVEIDGAYGEIKSMGLRSLRILTPDDTHVTIPHLKIWNSPVFNASYGSRDLMCVVDFYLEQDHDGEEVYGKLLDVAYSSPLLQVEKPVAVTAAEKPWGTHYKVKAYPIDGRSQFRFITDLTIRGKKALREMGVKFPKIQPPAGDD